MSSKRNRFDNKVVFRWKVVAIVGIATMMLLYCFVIYLNFGTANYGSFFKKLHFETKYFVQECTEKNCRFLPAEIEVISRTRSSTINVHVYLTKIFDDDGDEIKFVDQINVKDYQALPVFDAIKYFGKPYFINGCHVDFAYMGKFVKCTDSNGKIWNVRIPKTNEVENI